VLVKLIVETEKNIKCKIIIYLKKITEKLNKYIKNKNERKYKKLETNILKNNTLCNILKKVCLGNS